jgi:hypothetical protein
VRTEEKTRRHLAERGLSRGPALACGHLCVELALDGLWSARASERALFDRATANLDLLSELFDEDGQDRWGVFCGRIRASSLPEGYRDPERIAQILYRVLSPRRLLRLNESELTVLRAEMPRIVDWVEETAEEIESTLRVGLSE